MRMGDSRSSEQHGPLLVVSHLHVIRDKVGPETHGRMPEVLEVDERVLCLDKRRPALWLVEVRTGERERRQAVELGETVATDKWAEVSSTDQRTR